MQREIHLDGGEITVLKCIGLSGSPIFGNLLIERAKEIGEAEFIMTLTGLIDQGYVLSSKVNVRTIADVERAFFRVNGSYSRALRDAIRPRRGAVKKTERRRRG